MAVHRRDEFFVVVIRYEDESIVLLVASKYPFPRQVVNGYL